MNRVLRRPMFRIGGSAGTGITSGLDTPKRGLVDGPGKYSQDQKDVFSVIPTQEEVTRFKKMYPQFEERPKSQNLSRFLIGTGLNLASATPTGTGFSGLAATAAASAKKPFEQFQEDVAEDKATKFATEADIFKTLIEAKGEALSGFGGDVAKKGVKLQIADDIESTMDLIFKLETKQNENPDAFSDTDKNLLSKKKLRLEQLTKNDEVMQSLLTDEKYTQRIMRRIKENLLELKQEDGVTSKYTGDDDPRLLEDMFQYYNIFFKTGKFPELKAKGGRIGYAEGTNPSEMNTNQEPRIDFSTLRARLPNEIGDDIVRLIAASPEALEDFATIATQQDVDLFNQKYSVNLVLPQE
tara:strand:+ start:81 stop:1142 length:1062 start_codon:yes stop_codon:yes gene_type:complete